MEGEWRKRETKRGTLRCRLANQREGWSGVGGVRGREGGREEDLAVVVVEVACWWRRRRGGCFKRVPGPGSAKVKEREGIDERIGEEKGGTGGETVLLRLRGGFNIQRCSPLPSRPFVFRLF